MASAPEQIESAAAAAGGADRTPKPPRRHRWIRWLAVLLVILLATVFLLPSLIVWWPLRQLLTDRLSAETHLRLATGAASAGWLTPVRLENLTVRTDAGDRLLEIAAVSTSHSLWGLVTAGPDKGAVVVDSPRTFVVETPTATNIHALFASLQQVDPQRGLLGLLRHSGRGGDSRLRVEIRDGLLAVQRPVAGDHARPQNVIDHVHLTLMIERVGDRAVIKVQAPQAFERAAMTAEVCELGIKFIAPILAEAALVDGLVTLQLDDCRVPLDDLPQTNLRGSLIVHHVETGVTNPLIRQIIGLVSELIGCELATRVRLADESVVRFETRAGGIYHEGLAFGLPQVAPDLVIRTHGLVGFDQQLDLVVEVPLPFNLLGEGALLQRLGSRRVRLPVRGTLSQPELSFAPDGSVLRDIVAELTEASGGDPAANAATADLVRRLRTLAGNALERVRRRTAARAAAQQGQTETETKSKTETEGERERERVSSYR